MYSHRPGPSVAMEGKPDDEEYLVDILLKNEVAYM